MRSLTIPVWILWFVTNELFGKYTACLVKSRICICHRSYHYTLGSYRLENVKRLDSTVKLNTSYYHKRLLLFRIVHLMISTKVGIDSLNSAGLFD